MLLAHAGTTVSEEQLIENAKLEEGGLTPEELAVLARAYGLDARESSLADAEVVELVVKGHYPIVYAYRKPFDDADNVHAMIPVGFSQHFATLLDPLRGKRRVSLKKLSKARELVGQWAVVFR